MKAAQILDENQMEVAKIQLKDVARTWWLAEKVRLEKPITWDQFSKREILLQDGTEGDGRTIYQIAAESKP